MSNWRLAWPGEAPVDGRAVIRTAPDDFEVEEILGEPLSGEGEHLCVWLEKRGDNTEYVARQLTQLADCRTMDVGFCGLKDRHAVTRQWFSLGLAGRDPEPVVARIQAHWPVLHWTCHRRKLRRGEHVANRFRLRLRHCTLDRDTVTARFGRLAEQGCPNYFGQQRFGWDGANLDRAMALQPRDLRGRSGFRNGIYLSAARSWLFNEWLALRLARGDWRQVLAGDPGPEATGPMAGDDRCGAESPLAEEEMAFLNQWPQFMTLFRQTRMQPVRRSLVLRPQETALTWVDDDPVLDFVLPTGAFATVALQAMMNVDDAKAGPREGLAKEAQ